MSIVVVGINHRTAPVDLLERLAISDEDLPKAFHQLLGYEHVLEGAILSTCNRVEVYAAVSKFHGGAQDLRNFLSEFCHVAPEDFTDRIYTYYDDGVIRHLFRVAAGIDSMVVGESEILGQVRRAFQAATEEGAAGRILSSAFRRALHVGKRARSETAIGRNPLSISSAAVDLARRALGGTSLAGLRILIIGAGKMGRLAARALTASGPQSVTIVNRTEERGRELAALMGAEFKPFDELEEALAQSDIAICSTTAPQIVLDSPTVAAAVAARAAEQPLFIVDIAVPRDVDPEARGLPGVVLRDIDDLREVVEATRKSRVAEIARVEEIIGEEVGRFSDWQQSSEIGPTIAALVERAELIRLAELDKAVARLKLSEGDRAVLDQATRRMVAKLLHPALNKAKDRASSKQGHVYLAALRELFELDDDADT